MENIIKHPLLKKRTIRYDCVNEYPESQEISIQSKGLIHIAYNYADMMNFHLLYYSLTTNRPN